jgi:hypothetical protein
MTTPTGANVGGEIFVRILEESPDGPRVPGGGSSRGPIFPGGGGGTPSAINPPAGWPRTSSPIRTIGEQLKDQANRTSGENFAQSPVVPGMASPQQNQTQQSQQKQTNFLGSISKGIGGLFAIFSVGYMLKQSKIVSSTLSTISQLLGAMIDIFLMPFIPILVPIMKMLGKFVAGLIPIFAGISDWINKFKEDPWGAIKDLARGLFSKDFWLGLLGWLAKPENWLGMLTVASIIGALFGKNVPFIAAKFLIGHVFGPAMKGALGAAKWFTEWIFGPRAGGSTARTAGTASRGAAGAAGAAGRGAVGTATAAGVGTVAAVGGAALLAGVAANQPFDPYRGKFDMQSFRKSVAQVPDEDVRRQIFTDIDSLSGLRGDKREREFNAVVSKWIDVMKQDFQITVNVNSNGQLTSIENGNQGNIVYGDIMIPRWNVVP